MQHTLRISTALMGVFLLYSIPEGTAATYYVDNSHINKNDGWPLGANSQSWPWETISHAASVISPGDTVYVKARPTPYGQFTISKSNVTFVGYNTTFNDLYGGSGMPWEYDDIQPDTDQVLDGVLNAIHAYDGSPIKAMPKIIGGGIGTGITIIPNQDPVQNVQIYNFEILRCETGVKIQDCTACLLSNIYVRSMGSRTASGDGRGILLYNADYCKLESCVCYNVGMHAVNVVAGSDNNDIAYCTVYCDDNTGGSNSNTHYYFQLSNSHDNTFGYCSAERYPDPRPYAPQFLTHGGHGYVCAAANFQACSGNVFGECRAINLQDPFLLRGNAFENSFIECYGETESNADSIAHNAIGIHHGAHDNFFDRVLLRNSRINVGFWGAEPPYSLVALSAGKDNTFVNCIFESRLRAIELNAYPDERSAGQNVADGTSALDVLDNEFINCTFVGIPSAEDDLCHLFMLERQASGNLLINCIIAGFEKWDQGPYGSLNASYNHNPLGFDFHYCCFYNNDDPDDEWPSKDDLGVGNRDGDPDFVELLTYQIGDNSECIDHGTQTAFPLDYNGDTRDAAYDIGAQEYFD
jgi:hypothetical protein